MSDIFGGLPRRHFGAILVDPPWTFAAYSGKGKKRSAERYYDTMTTAQVAAMPVGDLAADDCCLFVWVSWPHLPDAFELMRTWGFDYKTCGFDWMKVRGADMSCDYPEPTISLGYWTRTNSEPCLLATRGNPKRRNRGVRMGIIEPRREHSRKPDCVRDRIMRLVDGPYLELFARSEATGWTSWGNEVGKFRQAAE